LIDFQKNSIPADKDSKASYSITSFRSFRSIEESEAEQPTHSMFTARAPRSAIVANDMEAWIIIKVLAQRESTGTSVGEKAVLVLKARNR
jgi:hypothetical protein